MRFFVLVVLLVLVATKETKADCSGETWRNTVYDIVDKLTSDERSGGSSFIAGGAGAGTLDNSHIG